MSYNPNFYNKFCGSNATFHSHIRAQFVPPPPMPPPFFIPPIQPDTVDQEFVKSFEYKTHVKQQPSASAKSMSISEVREELHNIIVVLNDLKEKEKYLSENVTTISDEEWKAQMEEINENKRLINNKMSHINGPQLDLLRKLLAKRAAKRLRMKRVSIEVKREKEEKRKELEERSRKIDENLQKIKDDIVKAQKEQEAKLEADVVLKEVRRKKNDAKKYVVKLDALVKLRNARYNTAKGCGVVVPDSETNAFTTKIDQLKSLWTHKLSCYETEEAQLQAKLKEDTEPVESLSSITEREVASNLDKWRDVMFGGESPQVDFRGNVGQFIAVRSQWDRYIDKNGSVIPIGWVPPIAK